MNRRKAPLLLALALLLAGTAVLLTRPLPEPGAHPEASPARREATSPTGATPGVPRALARPPGTPPETPDTARSEDELIAALRARYGGRLHEPHTQMRLLEQLMRHFQQLDPTGWEARLLALVRRAFPEQAELLAQRLRQRVEYGRWMEEHQKELLGLPEAERRAAVWAERERLFGEDVAERLWAGELRAAAVSDALGAIDALPQASVGERLERYQKSLAQTYGDESPEYVHAHQQELMNRFLDLGSVQRELSAMSPEARARSLREVRQGMGLDEAALERWKELDLRRDTRWELGERYMAERATLAQQASGPELDARLAELRARYFPDEAQTLAEEEASGFFRFNQPRQWGRN
ncbi:hypothetical protein D187_005006 [Cystobacter fuscus DSM 2262]|uniref:Lipase modulator n=1 Tax=Cystobacter fuscus (strain ATCC 25194 / DSM 2262 / NBRC 100088 / M29) TaxID=1242864 RepID=S9PLH1_CYSF2|nr:hypothetical protein [Cystobacter fuscus]EPX63876.1 hypothetical protein D187_005006 [Cystobacter fuscus DSM 2262]